MKQRRKEEEATTGGREEGGNQGRPAPPLAGREKKEGRKEGTEGKGKIYPKGEMSESEHCTALALPSPPPPSPPSRRPFKSFSLFGSVSARI